MFTRLLYETGEEMPSRFGLHIDPPLAAIPGELQSHGLTHFQTTLRDPMRLAKQGIPDVKTRRLTRCAHLLREDCGALFTRR